MICLFRVNPEGEPTGWVIAKDRQQLARELRKGNDKPSAEMVEKWDHDPVPGRYRLDEKTWMLVS